MSDEGFTFSVLIFLSFLYNIQDVWMSPERTRNVLAPTRVAPAGTPVAAMPPQNQKKKRPRMKDLFYDYTQNTTVHGISYITASGHFILRK